MRSAVHRGFGALAAPSFAFLVGFGFYAARAKTAGFDPFQVSTWARWDTGDYQMLAQYGYTAGRCTRVSPSALPGPHLCGTISWFPLLPMLMRAGSEVGLSLEAAGLLVTLLAWYGQLIVLHDLLREHGRRLARIACLLLAVVFPGAIYFPAIYPISLVTGAALLAVWAARRGKVPLAIGAGLLAGAAYPTGLAMAPALILAALFARSAGRRHRVALAAAGCSVGVAFGAVLLAMWASTGRPGGFFASERDWGAKLRSPRYILTLWLPRVHAVLGVERAVAWQTVLLLTLVGLMLLATGYRLLRDRGLSLTDWALAGAAAGMFLLPMVETGPGVAYWRAQALVVVGVPLLRRYPTIVLLAAAGLAGWSAWTLAGDYFTYALTG